MSKGRCEGIAELRVRKGVGGAQCLARQVPARPPLGIKLAQATGESIWR